MIDAANGSPFRLPLIAILRGIRPHEVVAHVQALVDEGYDAIEVPLNSPQWLESIALARASGGARAQIGGGTVLSEHEVDALADAGVRFIVTPNTRPALIAHAVQRGLQVVAGCATTSEAFAALDAGAQMLKLFPASVYGPALVRAWRAVLPPGRSPSDPGKSPSAPGRSPSAAKAMDGRERPAKAMDGRERPAKAMDGREQPPVPVFVVGGITPQNLGAYLAAGSSGAGIGGELYKAGQAVQRTRQQARLFREALAAAAR